MVLTAIPFTGTVIPTATGVYAITSPQGGDAKLFVVNADVKITDSMGNKLKPADEDLYGALLPVNSADAGGTSEYAPERQFGDVEFAAELAEEDPQDVMATITLGVGYNLYKGQPGDTRHGGAELFLGDPDGDDWDGDGQNQGHIGSTQVPLSVLKTGPWFIEARGVDGQPRSAEIGFSLTTGGVEVTDSAQLHAVNMKTTTLFAYTHGSHEELPMAELDKNNLALPWHENHTNLVQCVSFLSSSFETYCRIEISPVGQGQVKRPNQSLTAFQAEGITISGASDYLTTPNAHVIHPLFIDPGKMLTPIAGSAKKGPSRANIDDSKKITAYKIALNDTNGVVYKDGDFAYIGPKPLMPQLYAYFDPQITLNGKILLVDWSFSIEYARPNRGTFTGDYECFPGPTASTKKTLSTGETWGIAAEFGNKFRGGKATLTYNCKEIINGQITLHIRAHNPLPNEARNYLNSNGPWYAYAIAKHEGGKQAGRYFIQFNEIGKLGPSFNDYNKCPNRGPGAPYGWGMLQLDNIELPGQTQYRQPDNGEPYAQELWNWRCNVDTGLQVLQRKKEIAHAYLINLTGGIGYVDKMPQSLSVGGVIFTRGGKRSPEQLETIKKYNGGSFFVTYDEDMGWSWVTDANDYTVKVMKMVEK